MHQYGFNFHEVGHQGFGWGLLERFIVSKRLVVAEIALIEDNAVDRVALATGVRICLCPMTKRVRAARCPSRSDDFSGCLCSCPSRISA